MARLVLLNGPPGVGKSTLAQRYVDEHPLALNLDIDAVRGMLGQWLDHPLEAGLAARAMALEMARAHLAGGRDTVVPQLVARVTFIEQLEQLAREMRAAFHEVVLMTDRAEAVRRFRSRSAAPETAAHRDALRLVERGESPEEMYDALTAMLPGRPNAKIVTVADGSPELAYQALVRHLG